MVVVTKPPENGKGIKPPAIAMFAVNGKVVGWATRGPMVEQKGNGSGKETRLSDILVDLSDLDRLPIKKK
jgi:hypothetical protein